MYRGISALIVAALLLSSLWASPQPAQAAVAYDRISGADRYATSVAVSKLAFPKRAATVYLASGVNFADALSAGPAAVAAGGSMLLTTPKAIPAVVAAELKRLAPDRIVIVGGTGAVSDAVAKAARSYAPTVVRQSGVDRYETGRAVVRAAFTTAPTVYIATGADYPDALAAVPAAGAKRAPLLLVPGRSSKLDAATQTLLRDLGTANAVIVGGTGVVSSGIEKGIAALLGAGSTKRLSGSDRVGTSIAINAAAFGAAPRGDAYVATGYNYPDALAVGVLAGMRARPLYLSVPYCVPAPLRTQLTGATVSRVRLVGGVGAVRGLVGKLVGCLSITNPASGWVLVNKRTPLRPSTFTPTLADPRVPSAWGDPMQKDAAYALRTMFAAASAAGVGSMSLQSGYRSYATQASIFSRDVEQNGRAAAERLTARPGYSEHQTGFAADISANGCMECIGGTPQGRWLVANAWRYGFILRYESGQTGKTGYSPEPWHYRYVGTVLARDYHEGGFHSLEDYFGVPAAPGY
ncbi:LAS superfamily LD-carboxypeptidase LdcB/putative cell wall-binding protein [Agromyces terreus]|uniref:LAS superfamily LD-carboxypeptidase LdcB/putative cell wall-binding protein n=1 Tax=Agromyces terreus TaxID=424795 RepID=A0A9X2GZ12_9MICO|nr:cell wall-binding repeat-containing protein [Agromyces terreus]MCP2370056.1 LAS superfamily LD-carboxypeptidase LdcB/putative cell wall-binding protein [Agromyces terreus]